MHTLKLSDAERKGVKISLMGFDKSGSIVLQTIGKLMSRKPDFADVTANVLETWVRSDVQ
jgi:hypothetical protein